MTENDKNEEIELEEIASEDDDLNIDNASYKINTYGADFTLEILSNKYKTQEITVPEFQRRYVWPPKKASKLIESFLLGLPVPQIFLYREEETQNLLVVDGQQRLKTIFYFMRGTFSDDERKGDPFYLRGVKPEWEGKSYVNLSEPDKRRLNNYILRATIFEQTDPKDNSSIFEIFERLNTGGMALTEQEIRNCVIRGSINNFLKKLNGDSNWRVLLKKEQPDSRMKDLEMIARFFSLLKDWKNYRKPMKDFISDFMRNNKDVNEKEQKILTKTFVDVMEKIQKEIGVDAFRLRAGINIAIFDSITTSIAIIGPDKIKNLKEKFLELKENIAYLEAISKSTTDIDRVTGRIKLAIEFFSK